NGEYMLLVQTTAAPTDQDAVRRAIAAAIDPAQIVRSGFGTLVPADSFLPPVFAWHVAVPNTGRPARVAALLSAAGWRRSGSWWFRNGERLGVTITLAPEGGTTSQLIEQEQLRRAGIDASLKPVSVAQFNAVDGPLRSGHFTLAMSQWIGAADPEQSVIFACGQRGPDGNNAPNYCSPQFDALFSDQATTADPQRRRRDFVAIQA